MNCKFCGNFIQDGSDSCPICGRRQDEQPIGKLLSENMPNPVAAEEAREVAAKNRKASQTIDEKPDSPIFPIALLLLSIAGWLFGMSRGVLDAFNEAYSAIQSETNITKAITDAPLIAKAVAILTIVGVIALITIIVRLIKTAKYNKSNK